MEPIHEACASFIILMSGSINQADIDTNPTHKQQTQ